VFALIISYDLRRPERNYPGFFAAIESIGATRWLESVWIVETHLKTMEVLDLLQPYLDANDRMLVAPVEGDLATLGPAKDCNDWLRASFWAASNPLSVYQVRR